MKLPRSLTIGMWASVVLLPLVAAGIWWESWPEQTAHSLLELMAGGEFADVEKRFPLMPHLTDRDNQSLEHIRGSFRAIRVVRSRPRSVADIILGRQRFILSPNALGLGELIIQRNSLTELRLRGSMSAEDLAEPEGEKGSPRSTGELH